MKADYVNEYMHGVQVLSWCGYAAFLVLAIGEMVHLRLGTCLKLGLLSATVVAVGVIPGTRWFGGGGGGGNPQTRCFELVTHFDWLRGWPWSIYSAYAGAQICALKCEIHA